tara:strand:- start:827 stop:1234 length:408 start_codon:yes stop_codon:yes gene_type:complete
MGKYATIGALFGFDRNVVTRMSRAPIYKVIFHNQNQVYELYAKAIYQSEMYGFIEIEEFVFGEEGQVIVNPGEERLKTEFAQVKRSYIPMQSIIRIDEVEKEGVGKIHELPGGKVANFPTMPPRPGSANNSDGGE